MCMGRSLTLMNERASSEAHNSHVDSVARIRDAGEPAVLRLHDGSTILANRFAGEPLGDGDTATRPFLRIVLYWHRWFALDGQYRNVAPTFAATVNLGFLLLLARRNCFQDSAPP